MEEQHEIITPVFKSKPSDLKKHAFTARPAVKVQVNDVELTVFKGTNPTLATDITKKVDPFVKVVVTGKKKLPVIVIRN